MAELEKVYMVKSTIGRGTEKYPSRILKEFFTLDGKRIGEIDDWKDEQAKQKEEK